MCSCTIDGHQRGFAQFDPHLAAAVAVAGPFAAASAASAASAEAAAAAAVAVAVVVAFALDPRTCSRKLGSEQGSKHETTWVTATVVKQIASPVWFSFNLRHDQFLVMTLKSL